MLFLPHPPSLSSPATPTNGVLSYEAVSLTGSMCLAREEGAFKWAAGVLLLSLALELVLPFRIVAGPRGRS